MPAWGVPARWSPIALVAIAVALLALAASARAQTFTVTNLTDSGASGDGSLRGEVAAANANPGADTVVFASGLTGTIVFAGEGIVISDPVDIEGPGPGLVTIQQTAVHRAFDVEGHRLGDAFDGQLAFND